MEIFITEIPDAKLPGRNSPVTSPAGRSGVGAGDGCFRGGKFHERGAICLKTRERETN